MSKETASSAELAGAGSTSADSRRPNATTQDLYDRGWMRSFVGYWVAPDGLAIISEADALRQVTNELGAEGNP